VEIEIVMPGDVCWTADVVLGCSLGRPIRGLSKCVHSMQRGCIHAWIGKRTSVQINPGHDVDYQEYPTYIW